MTVKEYKGKFIELTEQLIKEHGLVSEIKIRDISGQVVRPVGDLSPVIEVVILF